MKAAQPTVEAHFAKCDLELRDIFSRLIATVEKFGSVTVEAKKTSIHLCNKTAFAGIRVMSKCIALTIKADKDLENPRITKHEQTSAHRWHLDVKLHSTKDLDKELVKWLRHAYDLSA
ncbi:MAG: hypothetical protein JNK57_02830 [Planctomycetaceae bacterium]|nr:hypothetical protein [Planctomycetaceae bacterium]